MSDTQQSPGASDESEPEPEEPAEDEAAPDDGEPAPDDGEPALLPIGNPIRLGRRPIAILVGPLPGFWLMATKAAVPFGLPNAALGIFVATFGVLDLAGSFDDADERVAGSATLG